MSARRLFEVFRQEFLHSLRRPLFWVLLADPRLSSPTGSPRAMPRSARGTARWAAPRRGSPRSSRSSQLVAMLVGIIYAFFVAVAAGMTVIRDDELKVGELLHATPLTPAEYVWGKYAATLASFLRRARGERGAHGAVQPRSAPRRERRDHRPVRAGRTTCVPVLLFALPRSLLRWRGTSFALGTLHAHADPGVRVPGGDHAAVRRSSCVELVAVVARPRRQPPAHGAGPVGLSAGSTRPGSTWIAAWTSTTAPASARRPVLGEPRDGSCSLGLGAVVLHAVAVRRHAARSRERCAAAAAPPPRPVARGAGARAEAAPLASLGMRSSGVPASSPARGRSRAWSCASCARTPASTCSCPLILVQTPGQHRQRRRLRHGDAADAGPARRRKRSTRSRCWSACCCSSTRSSRCSASAAPASAPILYATPLRTGSLLLGKALANTVVALA